MKGSSPPAQPELILASCSPRRAELLREAGYAFRVVENTIDEPLPGDRDLIPHHWAEALSYFKARAAAAAVQDGVILAADTLVALKGRIYGKATDEADARRILKLLMGTTHEVITGVTVLAVPGGARRIDHVSTSVTLHPMEAPVVDAYVASGLWRDKAGAYGIQDEGDPQVSCVDGSYSNVVGLPMERVAELLAEFGIPQPH